MSRILKKFDDKHIVIFLLLVSLLIHRRWISFDIFTFLDYGFKFSETLVDYSNFTSWVYRTDLGSPDMLLWRMPLMLSQSLFGHLGFDLNVADKFTILWPWVILSVIAPYFLVKQITGSKIGGIVGSLLFSYNTYFLSINSAGHFNISVASAFGVLALFFIVKAHETKDRLHLILSSIALWVTGIYDLRVLYLIVLVHLLYGMYCFLFLVKKNRKKAFLALRLNLTPLLLLLFLSAYWVIPILAGKSISYSTLGSGLFGDNFWSIDAAIALFHPFWTGAEPNWFVKSDVPFHYFSMPILALAGLVILRKQKVIVFFGLMSLLGIFLAKQTDPPFGFLYIWLYENFPGFNAFREATKFYLLIAIGYSVLIGAFFKWLEDYRRKSNWLGILKLCSYAVFIFTLASNVYPIFTGAIGSTYIPRSISSDAVKVNDYITGQREFFRTLSVPTHPHPWPYTSNNPRVSLANLISRLKPLYSSDNPYLSHSMVEVMNHELIDSYLDRFSVKYISIPEENKVVKDDFYLFYGEDRQYYVQRLANPTNLRRLDIGLEETILFENQDFRPLIYSTTHMETIGENISITQLPFDRKATSDYEFYIDGISSPIYVTFAQSFNEQWKASIGSSSLFKKNTLPESFHATTDIGLNSFKIDPNYIRKNIERENFAINNDGSLSFDVSIFYYPDEFIPVGISITLVTLVLMMGLMWKDRIKLKKRL